MATHHKSDSPDIRGQETLQLWQGAVPHEEIDVVRFDDAVEVHPLLQNHGPFVDVVVITAHAEEHELLVAHLGEDELVQLRRCALCATRVLCSVVPCTRALESLLERQTRQVFYLVITSLRGAHVQEEAVERGLDIALLNVAGFGRSVTKLVCSSV